jgi:hypothetical protein
LELVAVATAFALVVSVAALVLAPRRTPPGDGPAVPVQGPGQVSANLPSTVTVPAEELS